jgi:phage antirepressor YoqD-like protein
VIEIAGRVGKHNTTKQSYGDRDRTAVEEASGDKESQHHQQCMNKIKVGPWRKELANRMRKEEACTVEHIVRFS